MKHSGILTERFEWGSVSREGVYCVYWVWECIEMLIAWGWLCDYPTASLCHRAIVSSTASLSAPPTIDSVC